MTYISPNYISKKKNWEVTANHNIVIFPKKKSLEIYLKRLSSLISQDLKTGFSGLESVQFGLRGAVDESNSGAGGA